MLGCGRVEEWSGQWPKASGLKDRGVDVGYAVSFGYCICDYARGGRGGASSEARIARIKPSSVVSWGAFGADCGAERAELQSTRMKANAAMDKPKVVARLV